MLYAKLRSKLLCERTSSCFRSFDTAYEGSVLRVYVKTLYIAMYITYLLGFAIFFPQIRAEFLPRFLSHGIVRKITAESCGKSEHVRMDIRIRLHRIITEFIGKKVSYPCQVPYLEDYMYITTVCSLKIQHSKICHLKKNG